MLDYLVCGDAAGSLSTVHDSLDQKQARTPVPFPDAVVAGDMVDAIKAAKIPYMTSANIFDVYVSDQLGKDKKSIALSFTFASNEKTLKDEEIQESMDKVLSILSRKFKAKIRG